MFLSKTNMGSLPLHMVTFVSNVIYISTLISHNNSNNNNYKSKND